MSAEEALVSLLRGDPAVSAVVAGRIGPHAGSQAIASPYITYQRIGTDELGRTFHGGDPFYTVVVQVDCWSDASRSSTPSAYKEVATLSNAVRAALHNKGGVAGVRGILFEAARDLPEPPWQRRQLEFTFFEEGLS